MSKSEIIRVNSEKETRAIALLDLLKRSPKTAEETEVKAKWVGFLEEADISVKDTEAAVNFIYEKLGGLIRTHQEQEEVETKVKRERKVPAGNKGNKKGAKTKTADEDEADESEEDEDGDDE